MHALLLLAFLQQYVLMFEHNFMLKHIFYLWESHRVKTLVVALALFLVYRMQLPVCSRVHVHLLIFANLYFLRGNPEYSQVFQGNTDDANSPAILGFAHSLVPKLLALAVVILLQRLTSGIYAVTCIGSFTIHAR